MSSVLVITILISACALALWMVFNHQRKGLIRGFKQKCDVLEEQLRLHRRQIQIRKEGLNIYDFGTFNLKEALVVQPNISIN